METKSCSLVFLFVWHCFVSKSWSVSHLTLVSEMSNPNLFLIFKPPCLDFVCSQPGIRWRLTAHCSVCVCICLDVACTLGRTKHPLSMSRIIIISMATASSTSCSFSPRYSLCLSLSLSMWVICGVRSAAPTHSSPIPATKSEFWNCKRSNKQDWLQLSLLIAAPMCSHDL